MVEPQLMILIESNSANELMFQALFCFIYLVPFISTLKISFHL